MRPTARVTGGWGGHGRQHFDGTSFSQRICPKTRRLPRQLLHAVLGTALLADTDWTYNLLNPSTIEFIPVIVSTIPRTSMSHKQTLSTLLLITISDNLLD